MAPLDPDLITLHRRGRGQPIVLLHCLGMSWRFWDVFEPLTENFELVAYSFPGHHDTPVPERPYGVPELSAQLRAVLVRGRIDRAHLVGISMGGSVAAHFAGTYPEVVDRLALLDCTPKYDEDRRKSWPQRGDAARRNGVASLAPMLLDVFFTKDAIAADGPNVRFVRDQFISCSGEGYALACDALATVDVWDETARIVAPTLIALGEAESQSFFDAAHRMHETIEGSRLEIIPHAAHASAREQPEHVMALLREFLA